MSILDTIKAYQTPLGLILTLFGPQILRRAIAYYNHRNRQPSQSPHSNSSLNSNLQNQQQTLSGRLKLFLIFHTLYHLCHLLIPPFDLFSTPHLPILAPNDLLRSRLGRSSHSGTGTGTGTSITSTENPLTDLLLVRLQNLDNRILYLRYGHSAIQGCLWCRTPLDYLITALPDILSRYLLAAVGMVCLGNESLMGPGAGMRGRRWGLFGVWILVLGCLGEVGVRYLWDLRISNGDTLHLSHTIHLIRTTVLLFLPLLHTFLPPGPVPPNPAALIASLQNAQNTQRLTSLLRETISQDEQLRAMYTRAGRTERIVKDTVRNDHEVRQAVLDYRIGEASLNHARLWVHDGWRGLVGVQQGGAP